MTASTPARSKASMVAPREVRRLCAAAAMQRQRAAAALARRHDDIAALGRQHAGCRRVDLREEHLLDAAGEHADDSAALTLGRDPDREQLAPARKPCAGRRAAAAARQSARRRPPVPGGRAACSARRPGPARSAEPRAAGRARPAAGRDTGTWRKWLLGPHGRGATAAAAATECSLRRPRRPASSAQVRAASISWSYCTPDGHAVMQAMQPRHRSKCSAAAAPPGAALQDLGDQVNPAARRVHLLAPQLVGRAGGQAEPAVHAVAGEFPQRAVRIDEAALGQALGDRLDDALVLRAHQMPPANRPGAIRCSGSNWSLTARISSSDGTGPHTSTASRTAAGAADHDRARSGGRQSRMPALYRQPRQTRPQSTNETTQLRPRPPTRTSSTPAAADPPTTGSSPCRPAAARMATST